MHRIIVDSGSTKAQWLVCGEDSRTVFATQGINPVHQTEEQICSIICEELLPQLPPRCIDSIESVSFYGAGVRDAWREKLLRVLRGTFPQAATIDAESDMLGAARALLGRERGIACILGTGSNSCLYDGEKIVANVAPLGYILGDEGSGAVLGRRLLGDIMKGQLPDVICSIFWKETGETPENIIRNVYREPLPSRYLAGFAKFLSAHLDSAEIRELVTEEFEKFFSRNLKQYDVSDKVANFVGSIAYYFSEELKTAASRQGFRVGKIIRTPIDELGK